MKKMAICLFLFGLARQAFPGESSIQFQYSSLTGIGQEEGVMRRDPSDIIRVGDLYYVWYTKGAQDSGYDATIYYAVSPDGKAWTEKGEALARGPKGSWDEQSVFTPNILAARGRYWLYYTAVPKPFFNQGNQVTKTAIGLAVSDSPDGPWEKLDGNPILKASENPEEFDSMRVDDACLVARDGKFLMYFKGRQWDNTPARTKMGVAIAANPEGPYVKSAQNPLLNGGHEVAVWPFGSGVMAMVNNVGPKDLINTLQYAPDGLCFSKYMDLPRVPQGTGAYRPEAFTESGKGDIPGWGLYIISKAGTLPCLGRFDMVQTLPEVLIIGDSISIGYTKTVQALLEGKANVSRIPGNGQDTGTGLEKLDSWLGDKKWDVIHFNWGLWDICYRNPQSKNQGNRDKEKGRLTTSPEQYEKNLQHLVGRLKKTGARLIWASTTPVPDGELGRFKGDEVRYNAMARKIMQDNGIAVDDLYSHAAPRLAEYQLPNGNVHFTEEGYKYLAEEAARSIQSALQNREKIDSVRFCIIEQIQLRTAGQRNSRPPEADLMPPA